MTRTQKTPEEHAKAYVDSALAAQRESGYEPQVSDEAYATAVRRAANEFAQLARRKNRANAAPA